MSKRTLFILITIGYMFMIWIQSSHFNPESLSPISSTFNKTVFLIIGASLEFAHLFQFGLLYFFIILVCLSFGPLKRWQEVTAVIIALSYGIVDEVHQLFVPFRSFSIGDLVKDTIGILVSWWIIHRNYFNKDESKIGRWLKCITEDKQ